MVLCSIVEEQATRTISHGGYQKIRQPEAYDSRSIAADPVNRPNNACT